ncbi:hypothetical protein M8J76_006506 [Diaphorina citri]|nr:hypothetical protein M8J75_012302 [Diaphorina citri]KAI5736729.1 hypothetical protein M8J76_006506 [Diaphorina citri]KAI5743789.1 hypothetical protein M8J77_022154 [Diaphorina citri]
MPRIAPLQLIKCLSVLLTPGGGIKSTDEVARLVMLMQRFSKKLVSKCVYVSILKNTELGLLSDFMENGGWALVFMWLEKGIDAQNWLFIQEILELLMICPVDVARLKSNNIPKLVKSLSKNNQIGGAVQELAAKIVAKWLAIVKGIAAPSDPPSASSVEPAPAPAPASPSEEEEADEVEAPVPVLKITLKKEGKNLVRSSSLQDDESDATSEHSDSSSNKTRVKAKKSEDAPEKSKSSSHRDRDARDTDKKHRSESRHKSSSEKHRSSEHRSSEHKSSSDKSKSSRDREREKERDRSSKSSSSSSSASSKYLKDKERERDRERTKRKEKEEKDTKLTKLEKDRQIETDQATLARLMVPSINKLGKIPKKTDKAKINELKENIGKEASSGEKKDKPVAPAPAPDVPKKNISFSIEKRTPSDQKPKTVKTFNAKFRSTGLEEETAKPPPPRAKTSSSSSKHTSSSSSSSDKKPSKRPSPSKELPPEKKLKTSSSDHHSSSTTTTPAAAPESKSSTGSSSPNEKPKVTPPKPKVMFLQESDVFSSALNDALLVKETKKKKRKLSTSKEDPKENKEAKVTSPTSQKPEDGKPSFKFYRDTLDSTLEESKKRAEVEAASPEPDDGPQNETPTGSPTETSAGGLSPSGGASPKAPKVEKCNIDVVSRPPDQPLKGVLSYLKAVKRPKKSVQWRTVEDGFEDVFYFELDETERCNVSRPNNSFTDMRILERELERENFHIARKIAQEDVQEERTVWTGLIPIDVGKAPTVEAGKNSREKEIQKARQMIVKATIYGGYNVIPPTPAEPDFEVHPTTDPVLMPSEDPSAEPSTFDYSAIPWPEPVPAETFYPMGGPNLGPMGGPNMMGPSGPPMGMMPGMFPPGPPGPMPPQGPGGPFPPGGPQGPNNGNNWMGGPGDMSQGGSMPPNMPMGGPMPPFPPGMGPPGMGPVPPMGMNMGMMGGPMPPDMMMGGPFPPMGPPGMFGPPGGPGFNGPPGPWFGPGGPGPGGPNQGPPPNMNDMGDNGKSSSRSKSSGGSWHRGGGEPSRDKRGGGGRSRSTIPCRHKKFCKTRDCPYMHPSSR